VTQRSANNETARVAGFLYFTIIITGIFADYLAGVGADQLQAQALMSPALGV
jgi:hypothetical protein